jgi:hypothetical protein
MQINVINVALSQAPGNKYQIAEVIYKNDRGDTQTKKLMSFANPATYATLKDAKNGDVFTITQVKNDKGFWDWTSATAGAAAEANAGATGATKSFTPTKSSYETTEERARRQILIVKQSCLAQAINFDKTNLDNTLEIADKLVSWVLEEPVVEVTQA